MSENMDAATATESLNKARDDLKRAVHQSRMTIADLRSLVLAARPAGVLTVSEIAESIGRDRNYVDTLWSSEKRTVKGEQTRVWSDPDSAQRPLAVDQLATAARKNRAALLATVTSRAERNRIIAMVYASRILGPSAIAAAVGVDRNHVLRIVRRAGIAPAHREPGTVRNQHTSK